MRVLLAAGIGLGFTAVLAACQGSVTSTMLTVSVVNESHQAAVVGWVVGQTLSPTATTFTTVAPCTATSAFGLPGGQDYTLVVRAASRSLTVPLSVPTGPAKRTDLVLITDALVTYAADATPPAGSPCPPG